jgi:ankyrin repeat protein
MIFFSLSVMANQSLLEAVERNDINRVKKIIQTDSTHKINFKGKDGSTPLTTAAGNGNLPIMEILLKAGADINLPGQYQRTAIIKAIVTDIYRYNNPELTSTFDIVKFLVNRGADVNISDIDAFTPLMRAGSLEDLKMVKLLVEAGANVNKEREHGFTAIFDYITCIKDCTPIVSYLISKGADIHHVEYNGRTPFIKIFTDAFPEEADLNLAKLLIKNGSDINHQDNEGWSAAMYSAENDTPQLLKILIEKKAKLSLKNKDGMTALDVAKENDSKECIKILKKAGAK